MRHFDTTVLRNAGKFAFSRRPGDVYNYVLRTNAPTYNQDQTSRSLSPWLLVDIPMAFTLGGMNNLVERANATMGFYNFLNDKYRVFSNIPVNDVQKYALAVTSLHALVLDIKKRLKSYDFADDESLLVGQKLRYALGVERPDGTSVEALDLPNLQKRINKIISNLNKLPIPSGFGLIDKLFYQVSSFFKEDTYTKSTIYWFTLHNYYYWDVRSESVTAGALLPETGLCAYDTMVPSTAAGLKRLINVPAALIANSDPNIGNTINTWLTSVESILTQYLADETISEIARRIENAAKFGCTLYKQDDIVLGTRVPMTAIFDPQLSLEIKNAHLFNTIELSNIDENTMFGYLEQTVRLDNFGDYCALRDLRTKVVSDFSATQQHFWCTKLPYICRVDKDVVSDLDSSESIEQKVVLANDNMNNRMEFSSAGEVSGAKTQKVIHSSCFIYGTFVIYYSNRNHEENKHAWTFGLVTIPQVCLWTGGQYDLPLLVKVMEYIDFMPITMLEKYDEDGGMQYIIHYHYGDCDNYTVVDESTVTTYFSYLMQEQFTYGY